MDDLQTILDNLDELSESYVLEKARNPSDSIEAICNRMGVSKSKFYAAINTTERETLDGIARQVWRDKQFRALRKADEHVVAAMQKLVNLMEGARSEFVQLQSAQALLAYALGTPTQRLDVSSGGKPLKLYAAVSPDDWDE